MKNVWGEFKTFAMRGSVVDLAIGIVIGGAFGKIIDSLVKDVIMPPIGVLLGNADFSNLYIQLTQRETTYASLDAAQKAGAVTMNYGIFVNTIITFLIVAVSVFFLIRFVNRLRNTAPVPDDSKKCLFCDRNIPIKAIKCPECTADLNNA